MFRMQITCKMCFCFSVQCPSLNAPSNGAKSGSGVTYLSVLTFSCNTGYTLGGSNNRTCQADGSWSGNTTSCTSKDTSLEPKDKTISLSFNRSVDSIQVSLTPAAQCRAGFEPCDERRLAEQKSPVLTA